MAGGSTGPYESKSPEQGASYQTPQRPAQSARDLPRICAGLNGLQQLAHVKLFLVSYFSHDPGVTLGTAETLLT